MIKLWTTMRLQISITEFHFNLNLFTKKWKIKENNKHLFLSLKVKSLWSLSRMIMLMFIIHEYFQDWILLISFLYPVLILNCAVKSHSQMETCICFFLLNIWIVFSLTKHLHYCIDLKKAIVKIQKKQSIFLAALASIKLLHVRTIAYSVFAYLWHWWSRTPTAFKIELFVTKVIN